MLESVVNEHSAETSGTARDPVEQYRHNVYFMAQLLEQLEEVFYLLSESCTYGKIHNNIKRKQFSSLAQINEFLFLNYLNRIRHFKIEILMLQFVYTLLLDKEFITPYFSHNHKLVRAQIGIQIEGKP